MGTGLCFEMELGVNSKRIISRKIKIDDQRTKIEDKSKDQDLNLFVFTFVASVLLLTHMPSIAYHRKVIHSYKY